MHISGENYYLPAHNLIFADLHQLIHAQELYHAELPSTISSQDNNSINLLSWAKTFHG